jgi:hypothetical protein
MTRTGRFARVQSSGRRSGEPSWYGATVSPQLNRPMATEGRTQSDFWKAFLSRTSLPRLTARGGMTPFPRDRRTL